jgi:hypothetical protein
VKRGGEEERRRGGEEERRREENERNERERREEDTVAFKHAKVSGVGGERDGNDVHTSVCDYSSTLYHTHVSRDIGYDYVV